MKLIRIEHPRTERGIYQSRAQRSAALVVALNNFCRGPRHPEPCEDSKLFHNLKEKYEVVRKDDEIYNAGFLLFGFLSIKQLRAWFYEDSILILMHESGFQIVEIEGDITEGHTQATVDKRTMTSKKEFNLLEYLTLA